MYRRPKFLELLLEIRENMSRAADYEVNVFAEKYLSAVPPRSDEKFGEAAPRRKQKQRIKNKIRLEQKIEFKIERDQ